MDTPIMGASSGTESGITAGRLPSDTYAANFADLHPPFDVHEARVAADRCYFCHDAPCVTACPTAIDIPLFIRQIATGTPDASAKTILSQNILGGMCGRVCPTETLCEQACVRELAEGKPVEIGADRYMAELGHDVAGFAKIAERLGNEGKSPLYAAIDGKLAAIIAVAEPRGHDR